MLARTESGRSSSTDYREVFAALPVAMALVSPEDPDLRVIAVTERLAAQFGAHASNLEGRTLRQLFPPRSADRLARAVESCVQTERAVRTRVAQGRGARIVRLDVQAQAGPEGVMLTFTEPARSLGVLEPDPGLAVARAEQRERRRVGRELHDCTSQLLVAAQLGLSALERRTELRGETRRIATDVRRSIGAALAEIRTFSFLLHPPVLADEGLPKALENFGAGFGPRTGLVVKVETEAGRWSLPHKTEMALFRVAQEALMNVHRHAHARHATVRLFREGSTVVLEVEDDGIGLRRRSDRTAPSEPLGVGLSGMLARMTQLGGSLTLEERGRGLKVRAWAPQPER